MRITDYIKEFCEKYDEYELYENYAGRGMAGAKCLGIVVEQGNSGLDMLEKLSMYLTEQDAENMILELAEMSADTYGLDTIIYFPKIRNFNDKESEGMLWK